MSYVLVITGSRYVDFSKHLRFPALEAEKFTRAEIAKYWQENGDPVVSFHGNAPGVDSIFRDLSEERFGKDKVVSVPADWNSYGHKAGILRNLEMLDLAEQKARELGVPVKVLGFLEVQSKGTRHCINEALERGLDVKVLDLGDLKGEIERAQKPRYILGSVL